MPNNTYVYPPRASDSDRTYPVPSVTSSVERWNTLTDAGLGAIVNGTRMTSLTYDSGTGRWTGTVAAGSGLANTANTVPRRSISLTELVPDFTWEDYQLEFKVVVQGTAGLDPTTPFETGIGIMVSNDVISFAFGPAAIATSASATRVGIVRNLAFATSHSGFEYPAYHTILKTVDEGSSTLSLAGWAFRWATVSGDPPGHDVVTVDDRSGLAGTAPGDLLISVVGLVNTAGATTAHAPQAWVGWRAVPVGRVYSRTQALALPTLAS